MNGFDLATASIGLAASALAAALLLPLWRRAPVPAYRLVVSVLAAALALPLLQWGARALDLPVPHPARHLALALGAGTPTVPTTETAGEPLERLVAPEEAVVALFAGSPTADLDPATLLARTAPIESAPANAPRAWPWTSLLLGLWAAGALWALASTARRLLATRRLFARARPVEDAARLAVWNAVRAGSRLGARTRLFESHAVRTPACAGLWRPAVVLPADNALAGRPELLACVLTHELVHLERRDPWVLVGEELLRAAFWFHPAAWWLVARLGALRELSCDCLVVRRTGKRKRYASALVEYATWMQSSAPRATWAAVVPWSESRGHLTRRIEMLLQPETQPKTGRVVAPAAVGVLMTFLWSGQLALATSSCAGTRAGHEHEHARAEHHAAPVACEEATCEVQVVTHDGQKIVIATTQGGDPIAAGHGGKPLVYRVHGEPVEDGDGKDTKRVERCVVVLSDGDGEPKVLRGAEAQQWIEENGVKLKAGKAHSKQALVEEIQGAWREAEGGEREVIVVGPDGAKHVHGKKGVSLFGQRGESAFAPFMFRKFDEEPGESGQAGGVWSYHVPDGKKAKGFYHAPLQGETFELDFGQGHLDAFQKVHGEKHGDVHGKVHGHAFGGATAGQGFFGASGEAANLDELRRELEKTRAALEEQRKALEELRQRLQEQREKADTVGAWMR